MRRILILLLTLTVAPDIFSQENPAVADKLRQQYDWYFYDQEGNCYNVSKGDGVGICDAEGRLIISPQRYDQATYINIGGGFFMVQRASKRGACNLNGREIVPPQYTSVTLVDGFFICSDGDYRGVFDTQGRLIIKPDKYKYVSVIPANETAGETLFLVCKNQYPTGECGACDLRGRELWYQNAFGHGEVSEGMMRFSSGRLWGYADIKTGKVVIEPQYTSAEEFSDGMAKVSTGGDSFLISNPLGGQSEVLLQMSASDTVTSDVDMEIPETGRKAENTFAVIIANQDYPEFTVPFALHDGTIFMEYCRKTLGIPESNIFHLENATVNRMIGAVTRIREIADVYEGEAAIIFYYAGLGITDATDSSEYLLPVDGTTATIQSSGYSVDRLYDELDELNTVSTVILMDVGFDGSTRNGSSVESSRGVALKGKSRAHAGHAVCLTATSPGETAWALDEKSHGLFTYFLLKKLKESKGECSVAELCDYVTTQVKRQSLVLKNKLQTPDVSGAEPETVGRLAQAK